MSAAFELQKAIYGALTGDAALVSLLAGAKVYDAVPQDAAFPYVTLGQAALRDWSTGTEEGREHQVTIHVWSRAAGTKETFAIIERIEAALTGGTLSLDAGALVNLGFAFSDVRREADGETIHGVVRFRAVTEAT